jgi:hypothetical protein
MTGKHLKRKGVGCSYEADIDGDGNVICEYAYDKFGGYYACKAPKGCWLDVPINHPFSESKHCPNCSKPNNPAPLKRVNERKYFCSECGFEIVDCSK